MALLSDDSLFAGVLPLEWRPLLELLAELDILAAAPDSSALEERRRQANRIREKMLSEVRRLDDETPRSLQASSPEYKRWFTEATLLWPLFADTGGATPINMTGTTTLRDYPVDWKASEQEREVLRRALTRVFSWDPEKLNEIEAKLDPLTTTLRVKKAITRRLCSSFQSAEAGELQRRAVEFMQQLQGSLPWRPGDVELVISETAVFICLPYEGNSLTRPDFETRSTYEREQIAAFLDAVHREQQSLKSVRFPAFGIFDPNRIAPSLMADITESARTETGLADLSEQLVREIFSTMVTLLSSHEIDKYLVHDVWGHGWQETLCEFEWTYRQMPRISDPLALTAEAFETRSGKSVLRPEPLLRMVEADLRQRIIVGLNAVVSELLADLIEHKFSLRVSPLPSSSLLPESPLRIDLSLHDTQRMICAWRQPYRDLPGLRDELVRSGVAEPGLTEALDEAAKLIDAHFHLAFEDDVKVGPALPDGIRANLLQRVMLGVITLDAALERFLAEAEAHYQSLSKERATPRWHSPAACIDFIVLLIGWFYEQDRALHVWHLDELVAKELRPTIQRLEDALGKNGV